MKKDWVSVLLVAMIAIVVVDQLRFLFAYPVPDTGMWFGDESWTMLTLRALVRTGVARVPEAIGSSLAHSNGFINGSVWISGLLYGVPAVLFSTFGSPVAIGRVVTVVLSFLTLMLTYKLARRIGVSNRADLLAVFALVVSNVFNFSSHSARLDMVTGLAVLLFFYFIVVLFERSKERLGDGSIFLITFCSALSLAIYVHVPTLIVLPLLYSLRYLGVFRDWKLFAFAALGIVLGTVILVTAYWFSTSSLNLLGSGYNQYYNVANSIPVLHLTSWRVQKINTIDRAIQVWQVAWPLVTLLAIGLAIRVGKRHPFDKLERLVLVNFVLLLIGWGLFGGPAVFYNIYVMPVAAVCAAVLISPIFQKNWFQFGRTALATVFVTITVFAVMRQERYGSVGAKLSDGNDNAVRSILAPISSATVRPLILTDEPGENELSGNPNVQLMTNHFLLFGEENRPIAEMLREKHVDYLLLYSCAAWHSPFQHIADSLYTRVDERTGAFNDLGLSYDDPKWEMQDTLRLYRPKE